MQTDFVKPLLAWYGAYARDLPWRRTRDPYRIWVSEIMLQQTRVEAVRGYFERFTAALPDVYALADCPDEELLKLWEGLGYYSRARNLKKAAQEIVRRFGGVMPKSAEALRSLPGIGDYTSAAIASIAFGGAEPAVDGNLLRIVARLEDRHENVLDPAVRRAFTEELRALSSGEQGKAFDWGTLNQALMDLGATVCIPKTPRCSDCPLSDLCGAHAAGTAELLPIREKKQARKFVPLTVFLIRDGEEVALHRRSKEGLLGGMFEFPNKEGHLTEQESVKCVEEAGFTALRIRPLPDARHVFTHITWEMKGYEILIAPRTAAEKKAPARAPGGDAGEGESLVFVSATEAEKQYPIPGAFKKYAALLSIRTGKEKWGEDEQA